MKLAEAYPRSEAEPGGDGAAFTGPLSLYLEAGFAPERVVGSLQVVQRPL
jgi:hypothetical protein